MGAAAKEDEAIKEDLYQRQAVRELEQASHPHAC
jgi:hypothetical protein